MSGIDPRLDPLLVHPTLHYQNGGVVIDVNGATTVPGLYAVGEVAGGIHGRNRIMGNALLEIISFGRRAGAAATAAARPRPQESHPGTCEPGPARPDSGRHARSTQRGAANPAGLRREGHMESLNSSILLHPDRRVGADMERWRRSGGGAGAGARRE